jgi:hypothetical protein
VISCEKGGTAPSGPTVATSEGVVELYSHGVYRAGVMVDVNCRQISSLARRLFAPLAKSLCKLLRLPALIAKLIS